MLLATTVMDMIGWMPNYLRFFVFITAMTGGLLVVQVRAREPLAKGWMYASFVCAALGVLGCIPGIYICMMADDIPLGFMGPFLLLLLGSVALVNESIEVQNKPKS